MFYLTVLPSYSIYLPQNGELAEARRFYKEYFEFQSNNVVPAPVLALKALTVLIGLAGGPNIPNNKT